MRRLLGLAVIVAAAVACASAAAAPPSDDGDLFSPAAARGHGVVPTWAHGAKGGGHGGGSGGGGGGQVFRPTYGVGSLMYHGGPVMTTNTTYAIYWQPSNWTQAFPFGYSTLVDQYFTDVQHDNGLTSNVYYTETQYSGIQYQSTFAGSYVDTDLLPASGCSDAATTVCISDDQLQAEISSFVKANNLQHNSTTEFFVFTAPGIGSCLGSSGCAFTDYCAYHGWIGSGSTAIIYANQPYVENVGGCDAGHHPNAPTYPYGDAVLNVVSHEHNESITDPFGNAWYDMLGYEDGDKCAWSWGAPTGSGSTAYNQTINGHHYMLQLEYSNQDSGCVMSGL